MSGRLCVVAANYNTKYNYTLDSYQKQTKRRQQHTWEVWAFNTLNILYKIKMFSFKWSNVCSLTEMCLRSLIQNLLIRDSIHESASTSVPSGVHEMSALLLSQSEGYQSYVNRELFQVFLWCSSLSFWLYNLWLLPKLMGFKLTVYGKLSSYVV